MQNAFGGIKPIQKPHIPIYFGGSSEAAIPVAGKHADIYALWGETYDQVKDTIAKVRAAAAPHGRDKHIRFSLSLRPILADTEEAAWARAERILEQTIALREKAGLPIRDHAPQNAGSQRLLQAATPVQSRLSSRPPAPGWTSGFGPGSRPSPARQAIRPASSARPTRWPRRCWTTMRWASPPS